ncbi:MAG TPA: arginine deiminase family protein, partial [Saprospiraceae bacterium]|nr:arginine deiminase family protein [Saprospiraceae bacterium]
YSLLVILPSPLPEVRPICLTFAIQAEFMKPKVYVDSEVHTLRRLIVHSPDEGIDRISPKRATELLFDDIVHLPTMRREHKIYQDVLHRFLGKENVLETQTLIQQSLDAAPELKKELIQMLKDFEELPTATVTLLQELDHLTLSEVLISGYYKKDERIVFDPIPNFIFTRDIACTVQDHIVITKASKDVRHRENLLTRFLLHAHPDFSHLAEEKRLINLNVVDEFPPSKKGEPISIEGGDLMLIHPDFLLIGSSERTTDHALQTLKNVLFEKNLVSNVVEIDVPKERSFMHIDTLFTQINHQHYVGYKPIVKDGLGSYVTVHRKSGSIVEYASVLEFMHAEVDPKISFIWAGDGESPYQEREQWTDGCNLLTLRPGIALTYDRNPKTEKAFRDAGYDIIHAYDFLEQQIDPAGLQNTIITLPSSELSRARGGPHCMSCPVLRDPFQS